MKRRIALHKLPRFLQPPVRWLLGVYRRFMALSWQRKTALISLIILLVLVVVPLLTYAYYARDIGDAERLMNRKNTGVTLLDRNGDAFYSFFQARAQDSYTTFDDIPEHTREALIATEDKEFYEHGGFSFSSIIAAAYANVTNADLRRYGGSTITQQLVKNSLLRDDKTYLRKYQELFLSIAVDRQYEKDKILEMYLNSVYFGEGAFGIESAAETYFNKTPEQLTLQESSMLIGLLPAPSTYSPISGDEELAKERQQTVLNAMAEEGYITDEERDSTFESEITYDFQEDDLNNDAPHYALMVLDELEEEYGEEEIARSGFTVTTTLDLPMQREAQSTVKDQVDSLEANNATNGSFIAIDPHTGEIRSLVGSADWEDEEFGKVNMATTVRQPGSSFKPVYYTEALNEELITPASIIRDEPTTFGTDYEPENYDFNYRGDITVRDALATSLNIPSVKVMEKLGVSNAIEASERMGISTLDSSSDYGLPLALGTGEVQLLELANVYAAFANGGEQFEPTTITNIEDKYNRPVFEYEPDSSRVMSLEASFLINSILSDEEARAPTFGGRFSIGQPFAVKTGTTQDSRDAWTFGYTPNLVTGAWVGNNNNQEMTSIGGSSGAGPIIVDMARYNSQHLPGDDFTQPPGIVEALVCHGTERIANRPFDGAFSEYFIEGTVFDDKCFAPEEDEEEEDEDEEEEDENEDENGDENGNGDEDDSEENQPPTVSISASPASGTAPLEVDFSSEASDEDGEITEYSWSFGDGSTSTEENPSHTYSEGTYTATLTVTDDQGATASDSVTITVNSATDDSGGGTEDGDGSGPDSGGE